MGGAPGLTLAAAQTVLDELAIAPMSDCCMMMDSQPTSRPKNWACKALVRSANISGDSRGKERPS